MNRADPIAGILKAALLNPEQIAVEHGERRVTYAEFVTSARRYASYLRSHQTSRVMIALPPGPDAYAAMVGAILAGALYVPVNIDSPLSRVATIIASVEPDVVFADATWRSELFKEQHQPRCVDPGQVAACDPLAGDGQRADTAYIIMTSGSTGNPKGVVISMPALGHYVDWMKASGLFSAQDRVSQFPNISFDLSVLDIYGALNAGATLITPYTKGDRLFPADFARRTQITVWVSVPSAIGLVIKGRQATPAMLGSLRRFIFCGEPLLKAHVAALFTACPDASVLNLYGPTEATVSMTYQNLSKDDYEHSCMDSVELGRPIPEMGLHLIGGDGPDDGEIVITGPQLAVGYWRDPVRTDAAFRSVTVDGQTLRGYFTGDLARRRGQQVFFAGRIDRQMKVNGYRVEAGEVAARLADRGWPVSCVIKHRDRLVAVIEAVAGQPSDPTPLNALLHLDLEPYAVPADITFVESMPRNGNDKIDERAVRAFLDQR